MGKYYVIFGNYKEVVIGGHSYNACIKVFRKFMLDGDEPKKSISNCFRVNQKGFDEHEDDELIGTGEIIKLMAMSNKAKYELKKLSQKKKNINS